MVDLDSGLQPEMGAQERIPRMLAGTRRCRCYMRWRQCPSRDQQLLHRLGRSGVVSRGSAFSYSQCSALPLVGHTRSIAKRVR